MIIAVMLIMGVTAFVSCEKEAVADKKGVVEKSASALLKTTLTKENKMEYFNSLGKQHNDVLDYVGKNIDVSIATQEQRFNLASEYLDDNSITFSEFLEEYPVIDQMFSNPENTANLFFTDENLPCNLSTYYNDLGAILKYCLEKTNDSIEITPAEFNEMVSELENSIYNNYSVEIDIESNIGDEASIFLGTCAISRYSYLFWNNAIHDQTNPWYSFFEDGQVKKKDFWGKVWHGIKVAGADTGGFLLGGAGVGMNPDGDVSWTFNGANAVKTGAKWSGSVNKPNTTP